MKIRSHRFCWIVLITLTAVLGIGQAVIAAQENPVSSSPAFELVEVSDSVVMARHDRGSNITCIALSNGLYFVDAGLSTELACEFRRQMEARFSSQTQALILTHAHLDHFLGMAAFSDVPVVAAAAGRLLMDQQLATEWTDEAIAVWAGVFPTIAEDIKTAAAFSPTLWVPDEIELGPSENRILFRNTGGHSSCSSFVFFPNEGVLIAGDLVQAHKRPYFGDATNDLPAWIDTLKLWHGMEVSAVCPGHGPLVNRQYLKPIWTYFEQFNEAVRTLKEGGVSLQDAIAYTDFPDGYWPQDEPLPGWWPYCVARVYNAL
ncbi:MAG: MBL fold metallo-hydrolase [bacterium]|nr:MBL fold metallo-hydrolase [bacterium]